MIQILELQCDIMLKSIVFETGVRARGQLELQKFQDGKRITYKEAVLAKCYDCCEGYVDGRVDCGCPSCPLYHFMPYTVEPYGTKRRENIEIEITEDEIEKARNLSWPKMVLEFGIQKASKILEKLES